MKLKKQQFLKIITLFKNLKKVQNFTYYVK